MRTKWGGDGPSPLRKNPDGKLLGTSCPHPFLESARTRGCDRKWPAGARLCAPPSPRSGALARREGGSTSRSGFKVQMVSVYSTHYTLPASAAGLSTDASKIGSAGDSPAPVGRPP